MTLFDKYLIEEHKTILTDVVVKGDYKCCIFLPTDAFANAILTAFNTDRKAMEEEFPGIHDIQAILIVPFQDEKTADICHTGVTAVNDRGESGLIVTGHMPLSGAELLFALSGFNEELTTGKSQGVSVITIDLNNK